MKLTNQQVEALASKIYSGLYKKAKKEYDDANDLLIKKFEKTKEYQALNLLNDVMGGRIIPDRSIMVKMYDAPSMKKVPDSYAIKNEIILSTIVCDNLDDLIEKVTASVTE
jgi:hypothetical protein